MQPRSVITLPDSAIDDRSAVAEYLGNELHLRLEHQDAPVLACRGHLDALGMRIRRGLIEPLPAAWRRLRGRVGALVHGAGEVDAGRLRQQMASVVGHALFG